ncbi:MAG TPA: hypothetical protein VM367_18415 [Pseudonocardia sp.]|jgi:hypothetical protein|nr:hypothetical protein [Pseudonocardia sp.]
MSTTTPSSVAAERATPARRGPAHLATTVAVAAAGPLAIAAVRAILPYDTVDDPATIVTAVQAAPGPTSAVLWLVLVAALTLPLGVVIAGGLARRHRPVFGTVAAVVAWLGFVPIFAVAGLDQLGRAAGIAGLSVEQTVAVATAMDSHPAATLALGMFVVGHVLGAVLLGLALWRVIPRWAAAALMVSQPMHFVFAIIVPNHALDALAWSLTAVGFAAAALATAER